MYGEVPFQLQYLLRLDMFGNVVSKEAISGSLCFFNLDHLFPKSRGGYTVASNLVALSYVVNSRKGNAILNGIIRVMKDRESQTVERELLIMVSARSIAILLLLLETGSLRSGLTEAVAA